MPKSSSAASPSTPKNNSDSNRMSDVAMRKKKNADAQAAFRARRANYIATLEETVTSLEAVVIQLQESWRESRMEAMKFRQENERLRHEGRERERFWKALFQARRTGRMSDTDEIPPPLSSPFPAHATQPQSSANPMISQPYNNGLGFRDESTCPPAVYGTNGTFNGHPNYPAPDSTVDGSSATINARAGKYPAYPYSLPQGSPRDARWQQVPSTLSATMTAPDSITPPQSNSSSYIESPSLTSTDLSYPNTARFPPEEQKVSLNNVLDTAPYIFPNQDRYHPSVAEGSVPNSRSMSPTSTPGSSNSAPLTSSFPYAFADHPSGQDRTDFDYRRHSLPQCPEVTLHGGTADISLTAAPADVRYRMSRRPESSAEGPTSLVPPNDHGSHREQSTSEGGSDLGFDAQRGRGQRRGAMQSVSRSPSPGPAPISCTVAVIKAQAFGALRRTRTRTKRSSEGAAKVAMNLLEARGIGVTTPPNDHHRAQSEGADEDPGMETS